MNRLSYLRVRAKMSQRDLAARLNVQQGSISNWEHGRSEPTAKYIKPLANALNVSVEELREALEPIKED